MVELASDCHWRVGAYATFLLSSALSVLLFVKSHRKVSETNLNTT